MFGHALIVVKLKHGLPAKQLFWAKYYKIIFIRNLSQEAIQLGEITLE